MGIPLPDTFTLAGVTLFCTAMALLTYRRKMLDFSGSASAFVVGMVIGICGNVLWLLLLLVFLLTSFAATRYRFEWKRDKGFQEGSKGERSWRNIVANGAIPTGIALASFIAELLADGNADSNLFPKNIASFLFVSSIAVAASDTAASEIGIIDPRVYLITTLKRVDRGVDGGISLTGQLVAFVAAAYTSVVAYVIFAGVDTSLLAGPRTLLVPMLCGFFGCQVDSIIGATLERDGKVGKLGNNFTSILIGTLLASAFAL